jgi:hypothetical protein
MALASIAVGAVVAAVVILPTSPPCRLRVENLGTPDDPTWYATCPPDGICPDPPGGSCGTHAHNTGDSVWVYYCICNDVDLSGTTVCTGKIYIDRGSEPSTFVIECYDQGCSAPSLCEENNIQTGTWWACQCQ